MKPLRISRLKFLFLLVAVLVLFLSPALSAQAAPANSGKALIKAASKGDVAKVKQLLAEGADVNGRPGKGCHTVLAFIIDIGAFCDEQ